MNPRYLTAIESRIWAAVYGGLYAKHRSTDQPSPNSEEVDRMCRSASAAVEDFRAKYSEVD